MMSTTLNISDQGNRVERTLDRPDKLSALFDEARALTTKLAGGPGLGYAHENKAVPEAMTISLHGQLELEAQYQKRCAESRDYARGVSAFLKKRCAESRDYARGVSAFPNKRKPEFQGL